MSDYYQIGDSQFTKESFKEVEVTDLHEGDLLYGHLCYVLSHRKNKPLVLKKAGSYLSQEYIEHLKKKEIKGLGIVADFDFSLKEEVVSLLKELQSTSFEEENVKIAQKIIKIVFEKSFCSLKPYRIELVIAFYEALFSLERRDKKNILQGIEEDFFYLSEVAFFSAFLCLVMGYYDFRWVSDLYNLSYLIDQELYKDFSFSLNEATKREAKNAKGGVHFLQKLKNKTELDIFEKHPEKAYQVIQNENTSLFFKRSVEAVLYHHERGDGSGFPYGFQQNELEDWQVIISFSEKFIEREEKNLSYSEKFEDISKKNRKESSIRILDKIDMYYKMSSHLKGSAA